MHTLEVTPRFGEEKLGSEMGLRARAVLRLKSFNQNRCQAYCAEAFGVNCLKKHPLKTGQNRKQPQACVSWEVQRCPNSARAEGL